MRIDDKTDFVASTALAGAFTVYFPKNQVTLAFGEDRDEARRLTTAYLTFRGRRNDVLEHYRCVVDVTDRFPFLSAPLSAVYD